MPLVKQVRDLRVGDIILYKNGESRIITDIDHKEKAYLIRTTDLAGVLPRFETYDASDEVNILGSQGVLI